MFFIIKGRVKFYYEIQFTKEDREKAAAEGKVLPIEEAINRHVEGSYFGDHDVLINQGRDGRDSTAIAETECQLLVITKA